MAPTPTASQHAASEICPGLLYHYTTADGLLSILKGQTLWATNIQYLNDAQEVKYFTEKLTSYLDGVDPGFGQDHADAINLLQNDPRFYDSSDLYVVSFSEAGDLLSQWRGYASSGGFCIGFDRSILAQIHPPHGESILKQCDYDPAIQNNKIQELILSGSLALSHHSNSSKWDTADIPAVYQRIRIKNEALVLSSHMKHPSFREEKEWRLVAICNERKHLHFRIGRSKLIPYIELSWKGNAYSQRIQPIRSIRVGPGIDSAASAHSLEMLIQSLDDHEILDINEVSIEVSSIPYRF